MTRYIPLLLLALLAISCEKDLLPPKRIREIPAGTTDRLNNIRFFNSQVGICVGGERFNHSRILRTTNGGRSWNAIPIPEADKELFGVTQASNGRIYLIGYDGKLLYSDDLGENWVFRQLRFESYKAIDMRSPGNPVAVGGVSFDRGDVMELDGDGAVTAYHLLDYELNDLRFGAGGHAYRCGYGTIQYSSDSGRSWSWTKFKNDNYSAIEVRGERVWICGREGSIVRSLDGGRSWERFRNGTDIAEKKYRLNDIAFRSDDDGFAVGENGTVLFTRDAGAHWSQIRAFTTAHLYGLYIHPDGRVFICGDGGGLWELRY